MSNIFKAYDIRGVYPEEINKEVAFKIGAAVARFINGKTMVIGEDARLGSQALRGAVIDAITKMGVKVYYIGQCTTPLFYFSVNKLNADGGIMATASHNPPQYGGLKIVRSQSRPISSETGLKEIEKLSHGYLEPALSASSGQAKEAGSVEERNLTADYVDFLINKSDINAEKSRNLKLVIDAGNGMTPLVLKPLLSKLKINYTPLYFSIDCSFPNHSPDISKAEALIGLKQKVVELKADLGIAFDGDGDRVMFVDSTGEIIRADYILALLFSNSGGLFGKPKAVYDLRISKSVRQLLGLKGFRSRPGHSFIKQVMSDSRADIGAELSGHFFFKEMSYVESSVLAMLKVLKIISEKGKPISDLIKPFQKYFHSGEINIEIQNSNIKNQNDNSKLKIFEDLKRKYHDGKIDELAGLTVEYRDWWFNLRGSNTEPLIRLVVEADKKELMEEKVKEITELIKTTPT